LLLANPLAGQTAANNSPFDMVIAGARTIDPETGLDAVRDIGIRDGRIVVISASPLQAATRIEAEGLVAAPGFIDLHSHTTSLESAGFQAMDGVTTRLELELGVFPVRDWYAARAGRELINYGASVSHLAARYLAQTGGPAGTSAIADAARRDDEMIRAAIPEDRYGRFAPLLARGLQDGALGIGSGTQYAPGISRREMLDVFRLAAAQGTCVYTHIRYGSLVEPGSTLEAVQEMVANAAMTGSCVHIVHLNSMAMSATPEMLGLLHGALRSGVKVSTEIYPWDASNDRVRSVIFDPGWEARWGVSVGDLQSKATGKRLTAAEFTALRQGQGDDGVLMHMNSDATLQAALADPMVMVASDALDITDRFTHPRSAGTFARVLGHYVRDTGTLSLVEAIRKMSLMPAQQLEGFAPQMRRKGRLQIGADADIVVFDPKTVAARSVYLDARQYSVGMKYVLVNGVAVVRGGTLVPDVRPGRPVRSGASAR
jgi:dihydroorotase